MACGYADGNNAPRLAHDPVHKLLLDRDHAATAHGAGARPISRFHLDLDDCDDVAADANYRYLACHSTHAPKTPPSNPPNMDAWVVKLERRTGKLVYLTRLGGEGYDIAVRIKVDGRGHAYAVGFTGSRDFQTTPGALQHVYEGCESDAVLVEIGPDGQIAYSTFLGESWRIKEMEMCCWRMAPC